MQVTVGSILSRSLNVTLKNFGTLVVVAIIFQIPNVLVSLLVVPNLSPQAGAFVAQLADLVFGSLVTAGILFGVFESLRGGRADVGRCINVALSRIVPVILVSLVYGIAVAIGFILLIVPGIIIACMWYVAVPVTVVEKVGVGAALSRSAALTKGHRVTLFLVFLVFVAIMFALSFLVLMPLALQGSTVIVVLISFALAITIGLWGSATAGVAYHDLRVAKEGLSEDQLAAIFE